MSDKTDKNIRALKGSSRAITQLLGQRAHNLDRLSDAAKIASAAGATAVAVATAADWKIVIYISAGIVFVAMLFDLFATQKYSFTLAKARIAIDKALDRQIEFDKAENLYEAELERLSHFQAATGLVRDILEDVVTLRTSRDEVSVIVRILTQVRWQLFLAFGFQQDDYHTVGVYRREMTEQGERLVLKAHIRALAACRA